MGALKQLVECELGVAEFEAEDESGAPFQFEGRLNDGRPFYVRARGPRVSAIVGFPFQDWNSMYATPAKRVDLNGEPIAHLRPHGEIVAIWKAAIR